MIERPTTVSVVAAFLYAATAVAAVTGTSLLFPGTLLDGMWRLNKFAYAGFQALGRASGMLLALLGVVTAAAGTGILQGKRWAWRLAIAVFMINGLGDAVNLITSNDQIKSGAGALIAATFVAGLLRPNVKKFFES